MIRVLDTGTIPIIGMGGETIEIMGAVITCTEASEVRTLGPLVYEEVAVLRAREVAELRAENERLKGQVAVYTSDDEVSVLLTSDLAELRAENERLKGQVAVLTGELGAARARANHAAEVADRFARECAEVEAFIERDRARREAAEDAAEAVTP